jgi:hypothetical protein
MVCLPHGVMVKPPAGTPRTGDSLRRWTLPGLSGKRLI